MEEDIRPIKDHQLDFILAVGGGSSIDCAKAVSAGVYYDGSVWDFLCGKAFVKDAVPFGTILTLAATGSEMNCGAVISNTQTKEKLSFCSRAVFPKFSILDPSYTMSVPKRHTAAGIADIISHTLENYFSLNEEAFLQDRFAEAILKTCIHYGPIALQDPDNYEARANLCGQALGQLTGFSR